MILIEIRDLVTPAEIRSKQGIANVPPRTDESDAKMDRAFVKYRLETSIPIERNLRITAGNAMLGTSLATIPLATGLTVVTGATLWANPLLFAESAVVGYAADKVVTNVTGSETLGTIAGFAAGGVAGFGRVGAPTVAETLAVNRARNATVVLLNDGTTLYRGIPRAALDAKVVAVGTESRALIGACRSRRAAPS